MSARLGLALAAAVFAMAQAGGCVSLLDLDFKYDGSSGSEGGAGMTTASSTGGLGGGGSGAGGAPVDCTRTLATLSDEFDVTPENWCQRTKPTDPSPSISFLEGTDGLVHMRTLDSAWATDEFGPFGTTLYREFTSTNFRLITRVAINQGTPPGVAYHGAGLILREPGIEPGAADEAYVQLFVGMTDSALGAQWLAIFGGATHSNGPVYSNDFSAVAICRNQGVYQFFAYDAALTQWIDIHSVGQVAPPFQLDTGPLEVGLNANAYQGLEPVEIDFSYLRADPITSPCAPATLPAP